MTTITTRAAKGSPLSWVEADANFTNLNDDKAEVSVVALKAPLASPDLTGVPTAPTATNGTNTTQLATTAFVQGKTAAQTPSTALGNIVATNVQAALEELDIEKASLTGANFSGQVTATKLQTGVSGTNTNNFILDASAADGTMKLERGDGQDIMTVDAGGGVAFPQMGQLFNAAGYVKLPGGLIVQWGGALLSTGSANTWAGGNQSLPIPFPTACLRVLGNVTAVSGLSAQNIVGNASIHSTTPLTTVSVAALSGAGAVANIPISFIAIGH